MKLLYLSCVLSLVVSHSLFSLNVPDLESSGALIMNAGSGAVLFEKNGEQSYYPASVLKLATALYAYHEIEGHIDGVQLTASQEAIGAISSSEKARKKYTTPAYWLEFDASHMGIKKDEVLSLDQLFNGLLVASADDAANVIAEYVGKGSFDSFMSGMNAYLKSLGCRHTCFKNPHGLYHPDQKTTPYDMAVIARNFFEIPYLTEITQKTWVKREKTNKQAESTLRQTNPFVKKGNRYYLPQVIGGKTGTLSAGKALVLCAEDRGRRLVGVVMGAPSVEARSQDMFHMLQAAFQEPKLQKEVLSKGPQVYELSIQDTNTSLKTYVQDPVIIDYFESEKPALQGSIYWIPMELPILKGQKVGGLIIKAGTQTIERDLFASNDVVLTQKGKIKHWFQESFPFPLVPAAIISLMTFLGLFWKLGFFKKKSATH